MKKIQITMTIFCLISILIACNNAKKPIDTVTLVEEQNKSKFENSPAENDAKFLVRAAEIYILEIQLGQLAQKKGKIKSTKELGKTMEIDHTITLGEVTALANTKTISIPSLLTVKDSADYKELVDLNYKEFDNMYCYKMVNGHKNAILLFETAAVELKDEDIKKWAIEKLPKLKHHLEMAEISLNKTKKI